MRRLTTAVSGLFIVLSVPAIPTVGVASAQRECVITATLRRGARSEQVRCLESLLIAKGYSLSGPDNFFGTSTVKAVKAFQSDQGLSADGRFYVTLNIPYMPAGVLSEAQINQTYTKQQQGSSETAIYDAYALKVERQMDANTRASTVLLLDQLVGSLRLR